MIRNRSDRLRTTGVEPQPAGSQVIRCSIQTVDPLGLRLRPLIAIAEVAQQSDSQVTLIHGDRRANGTNPSEMLLLGDRDLTLEIAGKDAQLTLASVYSALASLGIRPPAEQPLAIDETPLAASYETIRQTTEAICKPLVIEDYVIQSMPDASPAKWHLAHTTWFFETFVLSEFLEGYQPFHPEYRVLFNSYYQSIGPQWSRPQRGLLSRPTVDEIYRYRHYVDDQMTRLFQSLPNEDSLDLRERVLLGLHHEQQHQELLITDLKHAWSGNPLHPVYAQIASEHAAAGECRWLSYPEGLVSIGYQGHEFCFDNERPAHRVFLDAFELASRVVTNAQYLEFIDDGGYTRPEFWLSDGWNLRQAENWIAPLYWDRLGPDWFCTTLAGRVPLCLEEPVCHVSYYEATAYARWAGARLPTEAEWETAATGLGVAGHFQDSGRFHPSPAPAVDDQGPLQQLYGDLWQWTASPYVAYPGYNPALNALGEYNGKFMCNQFVLRGASCATSRSHARPTYRNFFPPGARWQFSGIRLARDLT